LFHRCSAAGMEGLRILRCIKLVLRVLGAVVSALCVFLGAIIFITPELEDFWAFCHWVGNAMLAVLVGLSGFYMELKGSMSSVTKHFGRFAMNRIVVSIFYFWLGCYMMGGVGELGTQLGPEMQTLTHITGFVAWFIAAGDLIVSCTSEAADPDNEDLALKDAPSSSSSKRDAGTTIGRQDVVATTAAPPENPFCGSSDATATSTDIEMPEGGWNSGFGFGR